MGAAHSGVVGGGYNAAVGSSVTSRKATRFACFRRWFGWSLGLALCVLFGMYCALASVRALQCFRAAALGW